MRSLTLLNCFFLLSLTLSSLQADEIVGLRSLADQQPAGVTSLPSALQQGETSQTDEATSPPDTLRSDRHEPLRIACIGDSITAGARVEPTTASYPAQLQKLLGPGYDIRNFGIGGATLLKSGRPNVWQKLNDIMAFEPHVTVISLGTNDTVGGQRKNWENIARFEQDYTKLIETLATLPTHPQIVICTPTAMVLSTEGLSAERRANLTERKPRLQQLCTLIRQLAAKHAHHNVSLLELNAVLQDHPELLTSGDGVHPNEAGYRAIAKTVADHLQRLRQPATATTDK